MSVNGEPSRGRSASVFKLFDKKNFDSVLADESNYHEAAIKMNDSVKIKAVLQSMKQFKDL